MLVEQQTEWIISNNLVNKRWHIDNDTKKNVYFQKPKSKTEQTRLNGKRPDYILYESNNDKPIAIIEAKKTGADLRRALDQATEYATLLDVPIVFAMNGVYCEAHFVANNKELILNGDEVRELLCQKELLVFLEANSNEAWTISKEVKVSHEELISIFKNLNNLLRSEGLRAGIERFSEFANILFLKLLSENNKKSWWNNIKAQSNDNIIGYINSYVIEQIKNKYGGDVFTPISLSNNTLRHIIDAIDPLILSTIDTDIKCDAFECFLEKSILIENNFGEYPTPRNIIKTIINLIDPKFGETIYDPFCGAGGILTEVVNYIKENNIINTEENLERLRFNTLYGQELTKTSRIAKMNTVLQGYDGHSEIQQIDSLRNPYYISSKTSQQLKFDIVATNMPFSQTITKKTIKNGKTVTENHIAPLYYNGIAKNNDDAACVLHCLQNLKEGGRMALVVPEGFLFRKDTSSVRQFLLSKAKLQAVIFLPQRTFLSYVRVKTSILYFTDAYKPNKQKYYWFSKFEDMHNILDNRKMEKLRVDELFLFDTNNEAKLNLLWQ
ncbi:HsdM family class I SAM-dependent methyltransferase [Rickettsia australis]|uniref:site-specific DNA-methyltransferase (adenine-specific) n=1 Tax=Rickettsia australis (strain Cutlack) TaxID=1105110 RepID=H8K996_RICAC|nr:class I SAM-dependent DNA methyltransferase [Rickettsia australis]AFC70616.1 Type I restriction-modification system methyltransferase subunit [Rickettsia australis str. Cutlack]